MNGIDYFLHATGFEKELAKANMVITGEGSIDHANLTGKRTFWCGKKGERIFIACYRHGRPGASLIDKSLQQYFDQLISINEDEADLETAIKNTFTNLEKAAQHFGDLLSLSSVQN